MKGQLNVTGTSKTAIFQEIGDILAAQGFTIDRQDFNRPWGGFFVIDEALAPQFIATYFPNQDVQKLVGGRKVSPKILVVAPNKRLSWQYHHRRSEVWRVVGGKVGIVRSQTNEQGEVITLSEGNLVTLTKGERHRLVGLSGFGLVAEIWQHTDPNQPSDEDDIVRLADDFGR